MKKTGEPIILQASRQEPFSMLLISEPEPNRLRGDTGLFRRLPVIHYMELSPTATQLS